MNHLPHDAAKKVGRNGEVSVISQLLSAGAPVLHGMILPFSEDTVTELDVVSLIGSCIACFEIKAHGGRIEVSDGGDWIRLHHARPPLRFMDPRRQNRIHLDALRRNTRHRVLQGIVMFTGRVEFAPGKPPGIYRLHELSSLITELRRQHPPDKRSRAAFLDLARFHFHANRSLLEDTHHRTLSRRGALRLPWFS